MAKPKRPAEMTKGGRMPYLLRLDPALIEDVDQLADDERRSRAGQVEHIIREWMETNTEAAP